MGRRIIFREARERPGFSWGKTSIDGQMLVFYFKTECTKNYSSAVHNTIEQLIKIVKDDFPEVLSVRLMCFLEPYHLMDNSLQVDVEGKHVKNKQNKDVFSLHINPVGDYVMVDPDSCGA